MSAENPPPNLKSPFLMGLWCSEYITDEATEATGLANELSAAFHGILKWSFLAKEAGFLCPEKRLFVHRQGPPCNEYDSHGRLEGYNDCWQPLGIHATPLTLLTSLKPGLDSLFVKAAIEFKNENPYWSLTIRIVLPYEDKDQYLNCGIFDTSEKQEDFNQLYGAIVRDALNPQETVIPVPLDNDWCDTHASAGIDTGIDTDLLQKIKEQRNLHQPVPELELGLRLRAAGEYIAAFSDLLVASFDPVYEKAVSVPEDVFDYSVASIVEAKRRGLSWELIALTNNFTWADNGPVLRVGFESKKTINGMQQPLPRPSDAMQFMHPYDTKPKVGGEKLQDDLIEAIWQANGDSVYRRILRLQDEFNQLPQNPKEGDEITRMFPLDVVERSDPAKNLVRSLEKAASIRRRAADVAGELTKERGQMLKRLAALIGGAAVFLGFYEHWHSQEHHEDWDSLIQFLLLLGTTTCVTVAAALYSNYAKSLKEERRFDYRALGEALRIQIYWALSGLERSVASDYLQRHRDELDWIRYVVSGAVLPFRRWKRNFLALGREDQMNMLKGVHQAWIQGQEKYFEKNVKKLEAEHHFWHKVAWSFALAGVLQPLFMLGQHLAEWFGSHGLENFIWYAQVTLGLVGLPAVTSWAESLLDPKSHGHHQYVPDKHNETWVEWLRKRIDVVQIGLFISGLVGVLYVSLPKFPDIGGYLPNDHNWWIILNGVVLLAGGLSLAWTERNFHTEEHRSFSSMRMLYHSANLKLQDILDQMEPLKHDPKLRALDWERLRSEAQDLLYNLGCEHLSENADWLIYHRARPLEPFMAG